MLAPIYNTAEEKSLVTQILLRLVDLKQLILTFKTSAETKEILNQLFPESSCCRSGQDNQILASRIKLPKNSTTFEQIMCEVVSPSSISEFQDMVLSNSARRLSSILSKATSKFASDDEEKYVVEEITKRVLIECLVSKIKLKLDAETAAYNSMQLLIADPKTQCRFWEERLGPSMVQELFCNHLLRLENLISKEIGQILYTELDFIEKLNLFERFSTDSQAFKFIDLHPEQFDARIAQKCPLVKRFLIDVMLLPNYLNQKRFSGLRASWQIRIFHLRTFSYSIKAEQAQKESLRYSFYYFIGDSSKGNEASLRVTKSPKNENIHSNQGFIIASDQTSATIQIDALARSVFLLQLKIHGKA